MLNEGLEVLDDGVNGTFYNSAMKEITLPSTLQKIGKWTFYWCNSLTTIYVKSGCKADLSRLVIPEHAKVVWL